MNLGGRPVGRGTELERDEHKRREKQSLGVGVLGFGRKRVEGEIGERKRERNGNEGLGFVEKREEE